MVRRAGPAGGVGTPVRPTGDNGAVTTPPRGPPPAPTRGPTPAGEDDERSARLARWSQVAAVLIVAAALGTLVLSRFPERLALGVLALAGVGAAIVARRFRPPARSDSARGDGSMPGVMPPRRSGSRGESKGEGGEGREQPSVDERRARSTVVTIVLGSVLALVHLSPALAWQSSADLQDCLDGALTNQARTACQSEFEDDLLGWLDLP